LGPCDLAIALKHLGPIVDPRLLVGPETFDDAAVVALSPDMALVLTADFITPVVDDPYDWGAIAAANSLSDVFAMGGTPLAALNLVAWPSRLPADMLGRVLEGGAAAAKQAGCMIVGGHSVDDKEPKYGLAVVGTVHPNAIVRNRGARPGDRLYLTKALGTGAIATAIKADAATPDQIAAAVASMKALNAAGARLAIDADAHAMTDVTGFGLAGHLTEMLGADGRLGVRIAAASLPLLPGAVEQINQGMAPAGAYRNRKAYGERVVWTSPRSDALELILFDPQTSGGLLIAIAPEHDGRFVGLAAERGVAVHCIGQFNSSGRIEIVA
jgi:selenide, water dikinase